MDDWTLIAGLGNPGDRYEKTRHNAGFLVLDELARRWSSEWTMDQRFQCLLGRAAADGTRLLLCKPQTYMNASGEALGPLMQFYRVPIERVMVVVDDADLPLGALRLKPRGSSGGHHGLESIQQHLGGDGFARQRIGIGRRETGRREITGHVLGRFTDEEWQLTARVFGRACEQIECWLRLGIEKAMNQYNGTVTPPGEDQKERL
ncbi:MAG TPA: aminoacyl-tRNA hydrolase [Verrucomicrobiales bacterium]|nr:aminoacyl-tRNA hydrolase [Verrucomicrobiales bacterium]